MATSSLRRSTALTGGVLAALIACVPFVLPAPVLAQSKDGEGGGAGPRQGGASVAGNGGGGAGGDHNGFDATETRGGTGGEGAPDSIEPVDPSGGTGGRASGGGVGGAGASEGGRGGGVEEQGGRGSGGGIAAGSGGTGRLVGGAGQSGGGGGGGGTAGGGGGGGGNGIASSGGGGGGYRGFYGTAAEFAPRNFVIIAGSGGGGGGEKDAGGGGGGAGAVVSTGTFDGTVQRGLTIRGGGGGGGGYGGDGGNGGTGLLLRQLGASSFTIAGDVYGGYGGRGGSGAVPGRGGDGARGIGVEDNTGTISLVIDGNVAGGRGATGATRATHGRGGSGIWGQNLAVTVNGTVSGGQNGDGSRAAALTFTGGSNRLSFGSAAIVTGGIEAVTASTEVEFAQPTDFTLSNIISGAGAIKKTGAGTLTLSGTNTYAGGTTVTGGTLKISALENLGFGGLTLNGGALATTADLTWARALSLGSHGGTLDTAANTTLTVSSSVSGTGALTKTGAGTLVLSGFNSYWGKTIVTGGAISISANTNLGTSNASLELDEGRLVATETFDLRRSVGLGASGGTIETASNKTLIVDGVISGVGGLTKTGSGDLTLIRMNTYSGGTTISGGRLNFFGDSNLGAISSSITLDGGTLAASGNATSTRAVTLTSRGGTLSASPNRAFTLSGAVSGTGKLTKIGAGTLVLTGANSYSGNTAIEGGALQIGNGGTTGSITGDVSNSGVLAFDRSDNLTYAGSITGTGQLLKKGAGTLRLTGQSAFTGLTTVDAGTLSVGGDNSASEVTVKRAGTLGGTGTVGSTTVAGGTLAPGNSIGTLTVNGNLSFDSASTYAVEVSPTASDRVDVRGTATLGGAKVATSFQPGTYVAKQYTVLNAAGGVIGAFGSKVDSNLPAGFKSTLRYDPKTVFLDLALDYTPPETKPEPEPETKPESKPEAGTPSSPVATPATPPNRGLSPNQSSAANALTSYFNRTGGIPMAFGALTAQGLSQVAGEPVTAVQTNASAAVTQFMGALVDGVPGERVLRWRRVPPAMPPIPRPRARPPTCRCARPRSRPIPISGAGASGAAASAGCSSTAPTRSPARPPRPTASMARLSAPITGSRPKPRSASRSAAARPISTATGWARARRSCSRPGCSCAGNSARAISRPRPLTPGRMSPPTE